MPRAHAKHLGIGHQFQPHVEHLFPKLCVGFRHGCLIEFSPHEKPRLCSSLILTLIYPYRAIFDMYEGQDPATVHMGWVPHAQILPARVVM
jgi:hypothetical protein